MSVADLAREPLGTAGVTRGGRELSAAGGRRTSAPAGGTQGAEGLRLGGPRGRRLSSVCCSRCGMASGGGNRALSLTVRVSRPHGVPGGQVPFCLGCAGRRGPCCELAAASPSCGSLKAILLLEKELELH